MNQDNKEFELSGTLGSLNDAALNNLANQNSNETVATETNNNLESAIDINQTSTETSASEIEVLDVAMPTETVTETPVLETDINMQQNSTMEPLNTLNNEKGLDLSNNVMPNQDLNSIPTNFDIGDIGSVPPVDPTGKKEKKSKSKKKSIIFIILVIVFIIAIGALVFYYLRVSKGTLANAVVTNEINLENGQELSTNINDYATFKAISSSNCILNTKNVDTNKPGTYEYSITCGNQTYKGNIIVKDTLAPVVKTKTIVKKVNEQVSPEEFISSCTESSECAYAFENADLVTTSLTQAGTYEFKVIVSDSSENATTVPVKLIVMDADIKVYLNCVLAAQTEEGFDGSISLINKIGISNDLKYSGIYFDIKEYVAATQEEYNRIKTEYETNKVLSINEGNGTPVFDDTNLTITLEEAMSGEVDFGDSYSVIKTHYETTKNYKCNLVNVN